MGRHISWVALLASLAACVDGGGDDLRRDLLGVQPRSGSEDAIPGYVITGHPSAFDPYYRDTTVVELSSMVAEVEFEWENFGNDADDNIDDAVLVATINDPEKLILVDLEHWLLFGKAFVEGPALLTEDIPVYDDNRFVGFHAFRPLGKLHAGKQLTGSIQLFGTPGLRIRFDIVGLLPDGRWAQSSTPAGMTVSVMADAEVPERPPCMAGTVCEALHRLASQRELAIP